MRNGWAALAWGIPRQVVRDSLIPHSLPLPTSDERERIECVPYFYDESVGRECGEREEKERRGRGGKMRIVGGRREERGKREYAFQEEGEREYYRAAFPSLKRAARVCGSSCGSVCGCESECGSVCGSVCGWVAGGAALLLCSVFIGYILTLAMRYLPPFLSFSLSTDFCMRFS